MKSQLIQSGTPLLNVAPEPVRTQLRDDECRVYGCGEDRSQHSFFCVNHARNDRAGVSVALMVGGLVISSTGEVLAQGQLRYS